MSERLSETQQLLCFFVLAFGGAWSAAVPAVLYQSFPKWSAFVILFSPAVAALVTAALSGGIAGVRELLRRYLLWKAPVKWYLVAVLLIPALFLIAAVIVRKDNLGTLWTGNAWYFVIASFGFLMFITSGEEIGWRGFALPQLQRVVGNPLLAGIALGVIWGVWHLPVYLIPEQSGFPFPLFVLFTTGLSIIYTVLFNNTGGSLFFAVLLHASTDITPRMMQIGNFPVLIWSIIVALTWISAIVLYLVTKQRAAAT
jgi:membrane protease YdiL (CAAX protease family)